MTDLQVLLHGALKKKKKKKKEKGSNFRTQQENGKTT